MAANIGVLRFETPDGQVREYLVDFESAIIGRGDGNQIVIPHVSLSRRHARLTTSGGQLMIEDLSSKTGTSVNGRPLGSGERAAVPAGARIQIGECEGVFRAIATAAAAAPLPPVAPPLTPSGGFSSATAPVEPIPVVAEGSQFIRVSISSPSEPILPGASTSAAVAVQNRGSVVDEVSISVADLPPEWVQITRARLSLLPGARDEVTIVIRPPESPVAEAGTHQLVVVVQSRQHQVEVRGIGQFTVLPTEGVDASMHPLRGHGAFTLTLTNKGNSAAPIAIEVLDDEGVLDYELPSIQPLAREESRRLNLKVKRRGRKLFGPEMTIPFRVISKVAGSRQPPTRIDGALLYKPPLQAWKRPFLAVLLLAGLGGGAYGVVNNCQRSSGVCHEAKGLFDNSKADGDDDSTATASASGSATIEATASPSVASTTPATVAPTTPATAATTATTPATVATTPAAPTTAAPVRTGVPAIGPITNVPFAASAYRTTMNSINLDCPTGHVLTGLRLGSAIKTSVGATTPYISAVQGECRQLTVPATNRLAINSSGNPTLTSNNIIEEFNGRTVPTASSCAAGWAITGFTARVGDLFDALQPRCTQMADNGAAAGTVQPAKEVGGTGGSPTNPVVCPSGSFAIGAVVDQDSTGLYLFALNCAPLFISP